jgi:HPt (histidine-containing phosphotransfer) domain-containing protein
MIASFQDHGGDPAAPGAVAAVSSLPATTPEASPVDLQRLLEVSDDDPEQLREMVDLFLDESQSLMTKLEAAIQKGAAKEVEQAAHQFKGASSSCGMTAMVPWLNGLERMGRSGQLSGAAQACAQAGDCLAQIKEFLIGHLQTLP